MIRIKMTKKLSNKDIRSVYESNQWKLAENSSDVSNALENSDTVISAWHGTQLVGFTNALSDCGLTVYIHYLIVDKRYHGQGIGKQLIHTLLEQYPNYKHVVLATEESNLGFFEKLGFFSSPQVRVIEKRRKQKAIP